MHQTWGPLFSPPLYLGLSSLVAMPVSGWLLMCQLAATGGELTYERTWMKQSDDDELC